MVKLDGLDTGPLSSVGRCKVLPLLMNLGDMPCIRFFPVLNYTSVVHLIVAVAGPPHVLEHPGH